MLDGAGDGARLAPMGFFGSLFQSVGSKLGGNPPLFSLVARRLATSIP